MNHDASFMRTSNHGHETRGFSSFNLWRVRQLYIEYSSREFLAQAAPELEKAHGKFLAQPVPEIASPTGAISHASQKTLNEQPTGSSASPEADAHSAFLPVREVIAAVPWGHHIELLKYCPFPGAK
jgi:hypothetical protein